VLQDLGVTLGQGYYLARPAPLPLPATPIGALRPGSIHDSASGPARDEDG
jgi:EAL domain-containing protein (putative c-di-GMP-specific phosphodiesterase class I)